MHQTTTITETSTPQSALFRQHCPQCSPNPSAALLSRPGESSLRPSSYHSTRASPPSLAPQNHPQFPNHWLTQRQIPQQQQKTPNSSHKSHLRPANQRRNSQPRQSLNHRHPQHHFPKQSKPSSLSYALNPLTILPPISMAGRTSSLQATLSDSLSACPMFNPATHCVWTEQPISVRGTTHSVHLQQLKERATGQERRFIWMRGCLSAEQQYWEQRVSRCE